ncbi:MAG TPA: SoxR reducing system RseC family protein [Nitrospirota bacterium]|jgi:sigma-E factor negative regulatory protein RseC
MEEQGVVIELKGSTALVRMAETGGCEGCSSAGACKAGSESHVLEAVNKAGASMGQLVVVEFPGGAFLKASFIVYIIPVIMLFAGAILGGLFGPGLYSGISMDSWQAVGGVIFLALSLVMLRIYDSVVKKTGTQTPVITRVAGPGMEAR